MTVVSNTLSEYGAVLVYIIFYSKIFFMPQLQDLPAEWHTTYIMSFEICRTYTAFPEVYIYAIVKISCINQELYTFYLSNLIL